MVSLWQMFMHCFTIPGNYKSTCKVCVVSFWQMLLQNTCSPITIAAFFMPLLAFLVYISPNYLHGDYYVQKNRIISKAQQ